MNLGVLGGSFNPIHNGHIAMAEAVRGAHGLDAVLLVPAGTPPHKGEDLAPREALIATPGRPPRDPGDRCSIRLVRGDVCPLSTDTPPAPA